MEILFDFETEGMAHEDALLDPYELNMLFQQTKQDLEAGLRRKLQGIVCDDHEQPPRITITGRYDQQTEQMDIQYHIDTCCKLFLVRVVKILNAQG